MEKNASGDELNRGMVQERKGAVSLSSTNLLQLDLTNPLSRLGGIQLSKLLPTLSDIQVSITH